VFWIVLAIGAHIGNALVFVSDKVILGSDTKIGNPIHFAAWSGLVAGGVGVILLVWWAVPTAAAVGLSLLGGVFWVTALWLFFTGLKLGDPSSVVPIVGSAVPLFTLLFTILLRGETLSWRQGIAVLFLILGGAVLSITWRGSRGLSARVFGVTVAAGAAFAAHFITVDVLYDNFEPFLPAFAYARLGVAVVSVFLLLGLLASGSMKSAPGKRRGFSRKRRQIFNMVALVFVGGKVLGALALLSLNWAVKLGSVTIVNALQGTQYIFLLILALIFSKFWPKLWREELQRVDIVQKLGGVVLIGIGLSLLV